MPQADTLLGSHDTAGINRGEHAQEAGRAAAAVKKSHKKCSPAEPSDPRRPWSRTRGGLHGNSTSIPHGNSVLDERRTRGDRDALRTACPSPRAHHGALDAYSDRALGDHRSRTPSRPASASPAWHRQPAMPLSRPPYGELPYAARYFAAQARMRSAGHVEASGRCRAVSARARTVPQMHSAMSRASAAQGCGGVRSVGAAPISA